MFGNSLLINPITQSNVQSRKTYLPEHAAGWIDFWNGKAYEGGQYVDIPASIEKIPVFVKAGTILPLGMKKQYASENLSAPLEIHIYPGEDASFIYTRMREIITIMKKEHIATSVLTGMTVNEY